LTFAAQPSASVAIANIETVPAQRPNRAGVLRTFAAHMSYRRIPPSTLSDGRRATRHSFTPTGCPTHLRAARDDNRIRHRAIHLRGTGSSFCEHGKAVNELGHCSAGLVAVFVLCKEPLARDRAVNNRNLRSRKDAFAAT